MPNQSWLDIWKQKIYGPGPSDLLPKATKVEAAPEPSVTLCEEPSPSKKEESYLEEIKRKTLEAAEAEKLEVERARAEALPEDLKKVRAMIEAAAAKGHCRVEVNGRADDSFWDKSSITLDILKENFPGFTITRDSRYLFQFEIRWFQ